MSQHNFEHTTGKNRYHVIMGWDRQMNRYFGVILPWVKTDEQEGFCQWEPVWSNLFEGDGTLSLEEIAEKIISHGIKLPAGILEAVCRDKEVNRGNCLSRYDKQVSVFFETEGYAEKIGTFQSEEFYLSCFPALEKKAKELGFLKVTESSYG